MLTGVCEDVKRSPSRDERRNRKCSSVPALGTAVGFVLLALAGFATPASASPNMHPSPENAAATHAYLVATVSFQETELTNLPQSTAAMEAVAAHISGECPGILTGAPPAERELGLFGPASRTPPSPRVTGESQRQSRQREDLKFELSLALSNLWTEPDRKAAEALLHALTPLKWSNPAITLPLNVTLAVVREELDIPAPAVCADMKAWVTSGYRTLSPASKELTSRTEAILKRAFELLALYGQARTQPFPKSLAPYEDAADRALARRSEALTTQLKKGSETRADALKRLEATVGLPTAKAPKVEPPKKRKPVVVGRGKTAAGGSFVARVEPRTHAQPALGCVFVTITETSRPQGKGLLEILSGESTGRCLSRSHVDPDQAVHCNSGLLTIEADLLPATRSVRLLMSDNRTITSPTIRIPARLGGPAGLYYQVVRGPSPIPVSLTELDAEGRTVAVLKLPAVVECTKHPVKYFPGGIVRLVHDSLPQGPSFTIRGERYRKLGSVHFELKLQVSNEELLFGGGSGGAFEGSVAIPNGRQPFKPQASSGCQPHPYAIIYGLLKAPNDTVLARVSGALVPLHKVAIPAHLHAGGVLAYGAFSPLPTELLIRAASGRTIARQNLSQAARADTETCEGEAEG